METVEETVDVAVSVRTAYDQWSQFETFPQFLAPRTSSRTSLNPRGTETGAWRGKVDDNGPAGQF